MFFPHDSYLATFQAVASGIGKYYTSFTHQILKDWPLRWLPQSLLWFPSYSNSGLWLSQEESNIAVTTNHSSTKPRGSHTPKSFATVFGERTWVSIALWAFSRVQWCISKFLASWQALHSLQVTILNPSCQGFLYFVLSFGAGAKTPRQYKKASS